MLEHPPGSHRVLAARGHVLLRAGRPAEARTVLLRASELTRSVAEQRYLNRQALDPGPSCT